MITLNFLLASLIVVLIPGTGVVYIISTGLTLGKRASIVAALGCTAGIVPHLAATSVQQSSDEALVTADSLIAAWHPERTRRRSAELGAAGPAYLMENSDAPPQS